MNIIPVLNSFAFLPRKSQTIPLKSISGTQGLPIKAPIGSKIPSYAMSR